MRVLLIWPEVPDTFWGFKSLSDESFSLSVY